MKKLALSILGTMMTIFVFAQGSNLILFAEQGEQFWVILNGIKQNDQPQTNVKITSLVAPSHKLKIIFKEDAKGELDKTIYLQQQYSEDTYVIKKNNKNAYIMRFMNTVPLAQAPQQNPNQQVIIYSATPPPVQNNNGVSLGVNVNEQNTGQNNNGVSIGVNVNDQNVGVSFNMNINDGNSQQQSNINYSATSSYNSNYYHSDQNQQQYVYQMPGYNGPIACPYPMPSEQFIQVKQSIDSKSFDDTKLTMAKQVINSNCLLSSQVKEILLLFSFEDTRLELAKYAYGNTYDVSNYYTINDAFTFESTIDELNKYITSHPIQPIVVQPIHNNPPSHNNQNPSNNNHQDKHNQQHPIQQQPANVLPGYNGPVGCQFPMSQNDFANAKQSIASKSFEDSKLTLANQILNSNCLLTSQVKEIMLLFSFEDTRLKLAKSAYGRTYDIGNYYLLNDAFTFESSIDELNKYINGYKR